LPVESEFDKDMVKMQVLFDSLKHEYDLYFVGTRKEPPAKEFKVLEKMVRRYANTSLPRLSQQFRVATFNSKFSIYSEQWNRWLRAKEDGFIGDPRILGAVRKAKKAYQDMEKEAPDREEVSGRKALVSQKPTAPTPQAEELLEVQAASNGTRAARKLYDDFVTASLKSGEVPQWDFTSFQGHLVSQKETILQKYKGKDVQFTVQVKDGKVSLKAKVVK
jgi:hypothetical protein